MSEHNSFDQSHPATRSPADLHRDNEDVSRDEREHSAFIAALLPTLRTEERLAPSFDDRVMTIARSEAPRVYRAARSQSGHTASWWNRPIVLEMPRFAGLAMAAGLAGIIIAGVLGATGAIRVGGPAPVALTAGGTEHLRTDTVHVVRFVFMDADARSVSLVGDFNGWMPDATLLEPLGESGSWVVSLTLPRGRHEYAFLVNGQRWIADPFAPVTIDEFDLESSVVMVGSPDASIG